jgi:cellulose synthase (UDP-forming)
MLVGIYIERRYFIPESELILTAEKTWAMIGFATIAFIQFLGGIAAAYKSKFIKPENAWSRIKVREDKKIEIKNKN